MSTDRPKTSIWDAVRCAYEEREKLCAGSSAVVCPSRTACLTDEEASIYRSALVSRDVRVNVHLIRSLRRAWKAPMVCRIEFCDSMP